MKKIKYNLDKFMSKGTKPLVILLSLFTIFTISFFSAIVFIISRIISISESKNIIWSVITHLMDPGTIAGDNPQNYLYLIIMLLVTIIGLLLNSVLIGTISNAIDDKFSTLKKGNSKIIENNHTVIIGFNESTFTILNELIEANENQKKSCIVLLSNSDIEKMHEQLSYNIKGKCKTEIICRTGDSFENNVLDICSITTAKSVIINYENDFDTIKQIMVINKYLEQKEIKNKSLNITAYIKEKQNLKSAQLACKDRVNLLFFEDSISRLIAHSCRYPGISNIFVDFFDFDGDEIYYEAFPELNGMKFNDIILSFEKSTVIGLVKNGTPLVRPSMNTIYNFEDGDKVIHIAEDDNTSFPLKIIPKIDTKNIETNDNVQMNNQKNMLILGSNSMLPSILCEYNNYVTKGSEIIIATNKVEQLDSNFIQQCTNLNITKEIIATSNYDEVARLFEKQIDTVLILCDLHEDSEKADSDVMMMLLFVRNIIEKQHLKINVISEMRSIANQKIATDKNISDFVVGSNITSLVLSQISENPDLLPVFHELLDEEGSELYMKPIENYIKYDVPVDVFQLQRIAETKQEIVIGYKRFINDNYEIVLNPQKSQKVTFNKDDLLIVIAEN